MTSSRNYTELDCYLEPVKGGQQVPKYRERQKLTNYPQCSPFSLLEVFSVHVNKKVGNFYGKIKVDDGLNLLTLYERKKPEAGHIESESEPVDEGNELLMIGPQLDNITATDPVTIYMEFKNETCKDHRYISGWMRAGGPKDYNTPLKNTMTGEFGSVTVHWAMFSEAVGARVKVVLLPRNNDKEGVGKVTNVYGVITAQNSLFKKPEHRSLLFQKKENSSSSSSTGINVVRGKHIPLSKSVLSVPFPASLTIEVKLFDGNTNRSIAKGKTIFKPSVETKEVNIGDHIKVKVMWSSIFGPRLWKYLEALSNSKNYELAKGA